jgi:Sulfotransferase domain
MRAKATALDRPCRHQFIIVGAMKAGTTSLFRFLTSHPEIAGSATKELHYFSISGARWGRFGYESKFFRVKGSMIGEASPSYTEYPRYGDTARRIRALLPEVKLIYCMREPTARMRSHFVHEVLEGRQPLTEDESAWRGLYLGPSLYGMQLDRYLRYFEPSSIAAVESGHLRTNRDDVLRQLFEFLGVDPTWNGAARLANENVSQERAPMSPLFAPLKRSPAIQRASRVAPPRLRSAARSAVSVRWGRMRTGLTAQAIARRLPPIPTRIIDALDADRPMLSDALDGCLTIGAPSPATWWDPAAEAVARRHASALNARRVADELPAPAVEQVG